MCVWGGYGPRNSLFSLSRLIAPQWLCMGPSESFASARYQREAISESPAVEISLVS